MDLIEQYNQLLKTTEDGTITLLNKVLDQAFNRLVRRARIHMKAGYASAAQRNLALLQEFRKLIPTLRPGSIDAYERILRNLFLDAQFNGVGIAKDLLAGMRPERENLDVSLPLDAATAALQARTYLRKHGEYFATSAAEIVSQGVAEGRPIDSMVDDVRTRLKVVKARADVIVRTETLRAYNEASDAYYAAQGINLVSFYATSDDRSCSVCSTRAGRIYKRSEIKVPLHPRCRCVLSPWDPELAATDPEYAAGPARHRAEVLRETLTSLSDDLTRSVFEAQAPVPVR